MVGIYKITNKENGKVYVGQSNNVGRRWLEHLKELDKGTHHSYRLQDDYNEYGVTSFSFEVLELCEIDELDKLEVKHMTVYDVLNERNGYNIRSEGGIKDNSPTTIPPEKITKAGLIDGRPLNMYDKNFRNNINSGTMVNIYDVLEILFGYHRWIDKEYKSLEEKRKTKKMSDFEYDKQRNELDRNSILDITRCIKYSALGKDGYFKYTKYSNQFRTKSLIKNHDYTYGFNSNFYDSLISNIDTDMCEKVRLVEVLRLINKISEYKLDSSGRKILVYMKIVGLHFIGDKLYDYINLNELQLGHFKDWGRKFNIWERSDIHHINGIENEAKPLTMKNIAISSKDYSRATGLLIKNNIAIYEK